jgi:hypothetical protein
MKEEKGIRKAWLIVKWIARVIINRGYGSRKVWIITPLSTGVEKEVNRFVYIWHKLSDLWHIDMPRSWRI